MHTRHKAFDNKFITEEHLTNSEKAKHIMLRCILILLKY